MTKEEQETLATALTATGDYRILRKLDLGTDKVEMLRSANCNLPSGSIVHCAPADRNIRDESDYSANDNVETLIGAIVDVETTGIDVGKHRVIELAIRRVRFDGCGNIIKLDRPYSWREDPGEPLDPKITELTGLTDSDLAGQSIDDAEATALLRSAEVVVAHNAAFDRKFIERRLFGVVGLAWGCTLRDIDWTARGFTGRGLEWLLAQAGFFYEAHRAGTDVDAVIALLMHRRDAGPTACCELLDTASRPSWLFRAVGAAFEVKDTLKERGYRWDSAASIWSREVAFAERASEHEWLASNVYAACYRPRAQGPIVEEITWYSRYG